MTKNTKLFLLTACSFAAVITLYKYQSLRKKSADAIASSSVAMSAHAQIIESNSIEDVKKFIEPETLFILDYDNVLIEGKTDYGFDAWFCAMMNKLADNGLSMADAKAKLLPIYEKYQRSAAIQPVEACTSSLIENLKNSGYNVMILTVRSLCLIDSVFKQLKSVNIDIEHEAIPEAGINSTLSKLGSKYVNGILFCDGYYKGPALKAFLLGKPELKINKIVFVDDKLKNVESVKVAAQELGLNFVGIRYGYTDARTKAYALDDQSLSLVKNIVAENCTTTTAKSSDSIPAAA
jgi:hypothetical protein